MPDPKPRFNPTPDSSNKKENSFADQIENIKEVFKLNPELEQIGTIEEYVKYLGTIFPESKVKAILYHGSNTEAEERFDSFSDEFIEITLGRGYYFSPEYKDAEFYSDGWHVYAVVINTKNPLVHKYDSQEINDEYIRLPKNYKDIYDSVIGVDKNYGTEEQYVVFESNQIHILGSKKDIENFRSWLENQKKEKNEAK